MLLPDNRAIRLLRLIATLGAILALAACSFAPVYSSGAQNYNLSFASPDTRLEQIVYQDLVTRFGRSSDPNALLVTVKVSSSPLPGTSLEGAITLTRPDPTGQTPGEVIYRASRTATATRASAPQSLADQQSGVDAAERAAHQLAETVRLTLLGVLSGGGVLVPSTPAAQ